MEEEEESREPTARDEPLAAGEVGPRKRRSGRVKGNMTSSWKIRGREERERGREREGERPGEGWEG